MKNLIIMSGISSTESFNKEISEKMESLINDRDLSLSNNDQAVSIFKSLSINAPLEIEECIIRNIECELNRI